MMSCCHPKHLCRVYGERVGWRKVQCSVCGQTANELAVLFGESQIPKWARLAIAFNEQRKANLRFLQELKAS